MKKNILAFFAIAVIVFTLASPENVSAKAKISKKSITITKGKTYTLKIKGTKKKAKWTSSKKSVATVSKKGKIKAKKRGSATITAKIGKKKYKCKVKVETPTLSSTKKSIIVGGKYTLKLNGCSRSKKFYTSNKSIATVSSKGVITGKKQGNVKISVKISDKTYKCAITVLKKNTVPPIPAQKPEPSGTRNDPKSAYKLFSCDLWLYEQPLGKYSMKMVDFKRGAEAEHFIKRNATSYPLNLETDEEAMYFKFYIKKDYGQGKTLCDSLFYNEFNTDPSPEITEPNTFINIYDENGGRLSFIQNLSFYYNDNVPKLEDIYNKLLPGESATFSMAIRTKKNKGNIIYRIQTGYDENITQNSIIYTWFTTKK